MEHRGPCIFFNFLTIPSHYHNFSGNFVHNDNGRNFQKHYLCFVRFPFVGIDLHPWNSKYPGSLLTELLYRSKFVCVVVVVGGGG